MLLSIASLARTTALVQVDTASAVVIAMVLGAVVLVFWASRPSVIARYSAQNTRTDDAAEPADNDPRA
jgi:hypothetical protein